MSTDTTKIWKPLQNSRPQKSDMKHASYRKTNIRRHQTKIQTTLQSGESNFCTPVPDNEQSPETK